MLHRRDLLKAGAVAALGLGAAAARAEGRIRIAQQFGIGYLLLDVVRDRKLIEKQAKALGVPVVEVEWSSISGATAMNEALLAGSLDIVSAGVPPMLTMWDRTRGRQNVKAVAALGSLPNYLLSNNPQVRTLKDLGPKDRIAVPAAGVGFQPRVLQIEAARVFGRDNFKRLDELSVSLPHPDATAALIKGGSEINTHFSSAPFYYQALAANPAVHKVISSYDILGGPATFNVLYTTQKYRDENRLVYQAFYNALVEAEQLVKADKAAAADTFIRVQNSRLDPALVRRIVQDPENDFTVSPQRAQVYADELFKLGVLRNQAASWKDFFFEEAWRRPGS
ncbi:ABC transporter substrate-binding protein [uncultured Pseudacidovorax sp.]|uniref:ABC transporter substrate-binding protein n=1 Tax=uncultured Pseudacidovorax sp. TaxID=679313 RepID=UPI0025CDC009|nr:ABC transporter substrate-binding protein [uncultured Pseudacidovorax sp.]